MEENEDEADDRSELDVDEETRQFIEIYDMHGRRMSPSIPELDRDNEDILMIQYSGSENGAGDGNANHGDVTGENSSGDAETTDDGIAAAANEVVAAAVRTARGNNGEGSSGENSSNPNRFILHANFIQNRSSSSRGQVNAGDGSAFANGGEGSSSSIGLGSSSTAATSAATSMATRLQAITSHRSHLSTSSQSQQPQTLAMRARRTTRRGRGYHYINLNTRSTNPPVILQRLLGPGAQNIGRGGGGVSGIGSVSLATGSNGINTNSNGVSQVNAGSSTFRDATRVVVMDNGFGIFTNNEEGGSIDLVDQAGFLFGRSLAATLNNTPSALHWWLEEAKVLGLESQSDVCLTVCNSLIPDLEAQRSLELSQMRNGKRKKRQVDQKSSQAKKHHHEEQFSANERLEVQHEEGVLSNFGAEGSSLNASTQIEIHATDLEEGDAASNPVQDEVVDNDSDSMSSGQASILLSVGIISSPRADQDAPMNVAPPAQEDGESENEVRSQSQMSQSSSLTMSSSPISPNEGTSDSVPEQQPDASNVGSAGGPSADATKEKESSNSDDDETPKNNESDQVSASTRNPQDGKVCDVDSSSNASEEDNAVVSTKIHDQVPGKSSDANVPINVDDSDDDSTNAKNQGSSSNELSASTAQSTSATEPLPRPPGLNGKDFESIRFDIRLNEISLLQCQVQ